MSRRKKMSQLLELSESLASDSNDIYLFFADLVGSSEYKSFLIKNGMPDIVWVERQLIFLLRSSKIVNNYGGVVVKTIGDEIFAYFDVTTNPFQLIDCSVEIIQAFENLQVYKGKSKIEVKISIDLGHTYNGSIDDNTEFDPIGMPVDRCARLNSKANKNEIAVSDFLLNAMKLKMSIKDIRKKYNFTTYNEDLKGIGKTKFHKIVAK